MRENAKPELLEVWTKSADGGQECFLTAFYNESDIVGKKPFGDGTHIIYVNGSYKDDSDSELGNLIHDFFCENPAEMKHRQLGAVGKLKVNSESS